MEDSEYLSYNGRHDFLENRPHIFLYMGEASLNFSFHT